MSRRFVSASPITHRTRVTVAQRALCIMLSLALCIGLVPSALCWADEGSVTQDRTTGTTIVNDSSSKNQLGVQQNAQDTAASGESDVIATTSAGAMLSGDSATLLDTSSASGLKEKLEALEYVVTVTDCSAYKADFVKEKYIVTFTQPLDWTDSSKGTFTQRAEVSFVGYDKPTVFRASGYALGDVLVNSEAGFVADDTNDLRMRFGANIVNFEYRFFGQSKPVDLSSDSAELWQYLTIENAAADFNRMVTELRGVLKADNEEKGKAIFTGESKGGYTTNMQACLYPDCCDAYVSYVAPLCTSTSDTRFMQNIYTTIGNLRDTEENAATQRSTLTEFQLECIKNRDVLQDMLWDSVKSSSFRPACTKEVLFDLVVLETPLGAWQQGIMGSDIDATLASVRQALDMPVSTQEEISARNQKILNLLNTLSGASFFDPASWMFPYLVQSALQMGNYREDFSYLREAIARAKAVDPTFTADLVITPDQDETIMFDVMFTDTQKTAFEFDGTANQKLVTWSESAPSSTHLVRIYGGVDPWRAVRINDTANPNIHSYTAAMSNHGASIDNLDTEDRAECLGLLGTWLGTTPASLYSYSSYVYFGTHCKGTVSFDFEKTPLKPTAGDTVYLTADPYAGYKLESFRVIDTAGNEVTVVDGHFTVPENPVTVYATFVPHVLSVDGSFSTGIYTIGSNTALKYRIENDLSQFVSVKVDGVRVDPTCYSTASGSTIVSFTPEFLEHLGLGTHAVSFRFGNGIADATITVSKASGGAVNPVAATGDNAGVLYAGLSIAGLLAAACAAFAFRRRA